MYCEKCGACLEDGARFCGECGASVAETEVEEQEAVDTEEDVEEEATKSKGKGVLLFLIGVILAIALGLAGGSLLFEYVNDDDDVTQEEPGTSENEETEAGKDKAKTKEEKQNADKDSEEKADADKELEEKDSDVEEETEVAEKPQVSVEDEVLRIRAEYNDITQKVTSGAYTEKLLSEGVLGYFDGSELKEILVHEGVDNSEYTRYYYFNDGQLMFAYYESNDAHRFYFYEGSLMRWRYSKRTVDSQNAVNHDWENSAQFYEWEDIVKRGAEKYY